MIMNSSNKGKEIINKVNKEIAENPLFIGFKLGSGFIEWMDTTFMNIARNVLVFFKGAKNIAAIPFVAISNILGKMSQKSHSISRSQEYLSDSFATMYGMGPEIASFLTKIEYSDSASGLAVDKILSKIPIIGALHASLDIPVLLLSNSINDHPSTPARIKKILDELNKELKDSNLDPKTKKAVEKNIKDLEKINKEFTAPIDKKKYDAKMVKRMWINFISGKNNFENKYEKYYTNLKVRDKYVKESQENIFKDITLL